MLSICGWFRCRQHRIESAAISAVSSSPSGIKISSKREQNEIWGKCKIKHRSLPNCVVDLNRKTFCPPRFSFSSELFLSLGPFYDLSNFLWISMESPSCMYLWGEGRMHFRPSSQFQHDLIVQQHPRLTINFIVVFVALVNRKWLSFIVRDVGTATIDSKGSGIVSG